MNPFESSQNESAQEDQEPNMVDGFTDEFLDLLDKDPSVKEVAQEFNKYFNELKVVSEGEYKENFKGFWEGRVEDSRLFLEQSETDFLELRNNLIDMVDLGDFNDLEKEYVKYEAQKLAVLNSVRIILSIFPEVEKTKINNEHSLFIKRSEQAGLQQFLARLMIENQEIYADIETKIDQTGKKKFGSEERYEEIKDGVISLVKASYQYESMGDDVYFAPAKIDAGQAIDLYKVKKIISDRVDSFMRNDFEVDGLEGLDEECRENIVGVQVKTQRNLEKVFSGEYRKAVDEGLSLSEFVRSVGLEDGCLDGIDSFVLENATFHSYRSEGVAHKESDSIILSCPSNNEERVMRYGGKDISSNKYPERDIISIIQDAGTFFSRRNKEMEYIIINNKKEYFQKKDRGSFYQ